MAEIENFQLCLQKSDIQRSSDPGLPLRPNQWEMLYQNKSQHNGPAHVGRRPKKKTEPSKKRVEENIQLKSGINVSKARGKALSLSKFNQTIEYVLSGKFPCDSDMHVQNTFNSDNVLCCSHEHRSINNRPQRFSSITECAVRHCGGSRDQKLVGEQQVTPGLHAGSLDEGYIQECKTEVFADSRLSAEGSGTQETRITSLRKLLNSPLNVETSTSASESAEDCSSNVLMSANSCTNRGDNQHNLEDLTQPQSPGFQVASENEISEGGIMKVEAIASRRSYRKRSTKAAEGFLNLVYHDEVKEKIAELARTPRIKSLEEILESLHIKLDNKVCDEDKNNNTTHVNEKCAVTELTIPRKRGSAFPDDLTRTNLKHNLNMLNANINLNDCARETSEQPTNLSEEHSADAGKRVKILISGEISRQPKPSHSSKTSLINLRSRYQSSPEIQDRSYLKHHIDELRQETEYEGNRKLNWKILKKRESILARKRHVNSTKELKAILQARTSYRKEIPTALHNVSGTNTLEIPCKKPKRDTDISLLMSTSELRKYQWNGGSHSCACSASEMYSGTISQNGDNRCDNNDVSKIFKEDFRTSNLIECDVPYSPADSDADQSEVNDRIEEEITDILNQLPPLKETDISWTEPHDNEHKVTSPKEIQCLVNRMRVDHIEGVNGNYNCGTSDTFREWHETVVKPSYDGNSLTLLPYVIID